MVTVAPGLSTAPAPGLWVSTTCGGLTVVVVTAVVEVDEVDESGAVVVALAVVVVVSPRTE